MNTPSPITQLLLQYHVLHLATGEQNSIRSAPLFYAIARNGRDLIFISAPQSQHMRTLSRQPTLAVSIAPDSPAIHDVRGLQATGHLTTDGYSQDDLRQIYLARFPDAKAMVAGATKHRFYVIRLDWARIIKPLEADRAPPEEWTFPTTE